MLTLQSYDPMGSGANAPYSLVMPINGDLFISSVNLADGLGVKHKSLMETIRTYIAQIRRFGHLPFETATVTNSVGAANETTYCLLNENQALFVGSLSRNTEKVVAFKVRLIEEFDKARKALMHVPQAGLVKLVNDLLAEVSELKRGVNQTRKEYGKAYEAKVMHDAQLSVSDKMKRERIIAIIGTRVRYSPTATWDMFWEKFEESFNVDIRSLERGKNERTVDVAIRHGYADRILEYLTL